MAWVTPIFHTFLIACMAMTIEVIFTALCELPTAGNWKLQGYTYIWMLPIYCLIYPACSVLYPLLASHHPIVRGLLYMLLIYFVEYASGWAIRAATGHCPWEDGYFKSRWGVQGLIRLDFAPLWFSASLAYELVFRALRGLR